MQKLYNAQFVCHYFACVFLHTNMVAFVHAQLYTDNATNDQQALCLPAHLSSVIDV